jgi:hypothetical protein
MRSQWLPDIAMPTNRRAKIADKERKLRAAAVEHLFWLD